MRWMFLSVFLASSGCLFNVDGLKSEVPGPPGGGNTSSNLADGTPSDLAGTSGDDMGIAAPPDQGPVPPDLSPPFTPTHVSPGDFRLGTQPLTVTKSIETDPNGLMIDGAPAPPGVSFAVENNLAVLAVSQFNIDAGVTVRVFGALPLVVVSGSTITIAGNIDAGGHANAPGAGGSAPGAGTSAGNGRQLVRCRG